MKSARFCISAAIILIPFFSTSQKLKKADRQIVANMQAHINALKAPEMVNRKAGSKGEKLADEYVKNQFEKYGFRPRMAGSSWFQEFAIFDGRVPTAACYVNINNQPLTVASEYFPFAFSGKGKADGSVAIALAESGYPWFKDFNDLISDESAKGSNAMEVIRNKAVQAAEKGATALIIYNTGDKDLSFDSLDRTKSVNIPVIYVTKKAFKKYCPDESAVIDVKMNVELKENSRDTRNIIAFLDHGADSILIAETSLKNENNVAALIELARLSKNSPSKKRNLLFVAYSEEKQGQAGIEYFRNNPPVNFAHTSYTINLDSATISEPAKDGLNLVKQSIDIIKRR